MESSTLQPGPLSTRLKSQGALASPSVENGSPGTLPGIPARSNAEFADLGDELTVARRASGHHPHAVPQPINEHSAADHHAPPRHENTSTTAAFYAFATLDMMRKAVNAATPAITTPAAGQLTDETLQASTTSDNRGIVKPRNQPTSPSHVGRTTPPRLNVNLGIIRVEHDVLR